MEGQTAQERTNAETPAEENQPMDAVPGNPAGQEVQPVDAVPGNPAGQEPAKNPDDLETMAIDPAEDVKNASETIRDMAAGLVACAVVLAAVGGIVMQAQWYRFVLGVLLGAAVAGLMLRHLYVTIDRALDMDGEHASKYMKKSATLRLLMAGAALAAGAFLPGIFHVFGVFAGLLCLKFTAYLQPLTHKVLKFLSKGR